MKKLISGIFLFWLTFNVIKADQVYEAEDGNIFHGNIESEHTGFTGTGYVNMANETGSYVDITVSMAAAGEQTVTVYFGNGTDQDRAMDVAVNGAIVQNGLSFAATGAWTTYNTQTFTANLQEGTNTVRLTSSTANGGPNIDRINVTGEPGISFHKITIKKFGKGTVTGATDGDAITVGKQISLTAVPDPDEIFGGWKGDIISTDVSITFNMDTTKSLFAIFLRKGAHANTDTLVGWANYNYNVTGGEGGTEVTVTNQSQLESYINKSGKYIIKVQGAINITPFGKKMDVGSDKTIIGIDENATITGGGFRIYNATNVIIRYLTMKDAYVDWEGKTTDNDAIEINNSKHVWLDHCDLSHFDDGLCDIKNGSDYVTVSWCHFHNHNKVMLIGSGDGETQDIGHLNVTVHHNWFDGAGGNGIGQRLPMARFGMVHVFNNYYNDVLIRGVEANYDANIVVDNNYFLNAALPHVIVGGAGDNKMNASGNVFVDSGSRRDNNNKAFDPSDYYTVEYNHAEDVPALVMLGAGVNFITEIGEKDTTTVGLSQHKDVDGRLFQNYPNPCNEITTIPYFVENTNYVEIEIFDYTGKQTASLVNHVKGYGNHTVEFNTANLKPGIYLYKLNMGNAHQRKTMIIAR